MTNTPLDPKIESVQRLYAAYGRGDIDGVLAELSDDVDWGGRGGQRLRTLVRQLPRQERGAAVLRQMASNVDISQFDLVSFTSNETDVIVAVQWAYTVRATGRSTAMYMQHWFRFVDGTIAFFRGSEDSEQTAAAFG